MTDAIFLGSFHFGKGLVVSLGLKAKIESKAFVAACRNDSSVNNIFSKNEACSIVITNRTGYGRLGVRIAAYQLVQRVFAKLLFKKFNEWTR
jgi:hypothetical protein